MDAYKLEGQRERLMALSKEQWRVVLNALTRHMTKKLGAMHIENELTGGRLVNGKAKTGAHSELALGGNALQHYQGGAIKALYSGEEAWEEGTDLPLTMMEIVDKLMKEQVKEWRKRQRRLGQRTDKDVESLAEKDQPQDEEDDRPQMLAMMWKAAKGDPE